MAPGEDPAAAASTDATGNSEKPSENRTTFRSQYRQLHRSQSLTSTGLVNSLRSHFEPSTTPTKLVDNKSKLRTPKPPKSPKPKLKRVLKKSSSVDTDSVKTQKRVSFTLDEEKPAPVPKPRTSIPIKEVIVEQKTITEPEVLHVETVVLSSTPPSTSSLLDLNSNYVPIEFAEPEDRHRIASESPRASIEDIASETLDAFEMDAKKSHNKRSPSFRSKLMTIFSKDKKSTTKDDQNKTKTKKIENAVFADNAQNETFNRHSVQRHTMDPLPRRTSPEQLESRYAAMHINAFQQARNHFTQPHHANEDYVCMETTGKTGKNGEQRKNYMNIPTRYDSSSTNTIESEQSTTSASLLQSQQERMAVRTHFFNGTTPPRAQDTHPNVLQLVNPKAAIPINSERPLPNPYQQQVNGNASDYGTVYDSSDVSSLSSPRSPSVERTKLRLPSHRERIDLQPRLKSPIPHSEVSTDKLIATELLKNAKNKAESKRSSPSHQKLEMEIDYPLEPVPAATPTRDAVMEAADWHRVQRELAESPGAGRVITTTNAVVHVDSSPVPPPEDTSSRCETPVMLMRRGSNLSLQRSPPKHEIRQTVEAFCWKELKKLKEKEEMQLQQMLGPMVSSRGYAEDPIRRSRSMGVTQRDTKRSTSLPRETRNTEDAELNALRMAQAQRFQRHSPQRNTIGPTRPIFNRGSLTQQLDQQPIYSKKVSFHSPQNPPNAWPTRNGFTQSPPQRRLDASPQPTATGTPRESLEDEVFLPSESPSRDEIFLLNQQRQKELLMAKAQRGNAPHPVADSVDGSGEVPPMRTLREPIYVQRNTLNHEGIYGTRRNESLYGTRIPEETIYGHYGIRPPRQQEEPIFATRESAMMAHAAMYGSNWYPEPIYGRRLSNGHAAPPANHRPPQPIQPPTSGLQRSNSLYGGCPNKPPSGAHLRQQPPQPQRYDYPPPEASPEAIYGQHKMTTVNNKVCDIYGRIHDTSGPPVSPGPAAGVLYGQLQRNAYTGPMQYQSYQQLQPSGNHFVRGTRLTASVNDMHRYNSSSALMPTSGGGRTEPPNRPLPPIPDAGKKSRFGFRKKASPTSKAEEEWNSDGKRGGGGGLSGSESGGRSDTDGDLRSRSGRNNRRDDPRRHTLAGEQYGVMSSQGGPLSRTMDLEGQPRGYPPPSNAMLFDDDPGIMSEVETSSTGFRRGGKQRSSLPVVRTPSKTLERPLGLVFLQYRNETKRALLPNEITSIDTVKALFVRSFPKQLTMEYLDSPQVKIYIHDSSKDMFYELEDLRSHLREIRDRSVLRLFESADVTGGLPMAGIGIAGGAGVPHFEDPSYFSEPEFDTEYQHQHIHKSKGSAKGAPYYIGSTASLPRAGLLRAYSPAVGNLPPDRMKTLPTGAPPKPQRAYSSGASRSGADGAGDRFAQFAQRPNNSLYSIPDGYMSSPERGSRYEETYYSQYGARSGSITPVIDEEVSDTELIDEYSIYGVKMAPGGPRPAPRTQFATPAAPPYDATRIRVENMERQLANLTGLVQKALTHAPATLQVPSTGRDSYRGADDACDVNMNSLTMMMMSPSASSCSMQMLLADDTYVRSETKPPKLGKSGCHKSVSFEKSVSFSDEPPDMNSPKQHSPQHSADTKPTKPAIKSSTLPRTSSQERDRDRDRLKPAPPPKPASLSPGQYDGRHIYRDLQLTPEMYNQLRGLQKKAKDLRAEVRNLRRMSQAQAHSVRETIRDTFIKIRAMLMVGGEQVWQAGMDQERTRLSREEDLYKQEMIRLETDLSDLESTVEELRGNVINRKTRVNMSDVENMALILSKSSKTVADLKLRFPMLQDGMKSMLNTEMEKVVREETFLKEEPERLESALRRCKKLTGTLVTLKRLASVQEQRLPCSATAADGRLSPTEPAPITPTSAQHSKPVAGARVGSFGVGGDAANAADGHQRPENALDALLDELQTFSKPHNNASTTSSSTTTTTVNTQIPQVSYPPDGEAPSLPAKGIHPPSMHEIGRKGSMDSATLLPTQTLTVSTATGSLRRLHSYPSGSDTDNSPPIQPTPLAGGKGGKPPLPERNTDLLQHISTKRVPPPPPPRTSSKSPLASPTSPSLPPRSPASNLQHIQNVQTIVEQQQQAAAKPMSQFEAATQNLGLGTLRRNHAHRGSLKEAGANGKSATLPRNIGSNLQVHNASTTSSEGDTAISASNSSSCESVNSQDGTKKRKEELEQRHQELLKKQKALQEQYARLQQLQRGTNTLAVIPPAPDQLLKKTGSESNILQKMGLQMTTSAITGSLTNLPMKSNANAANNNTQSDNETSTSSTASSNTNKVYETDIL